MICHVMLCYVMLCYIMISCDMSCYVMICHDMLWYDMLCHIMSRYVMICYDTLPSSLHSTLFDNTFFTKRCYIIFFTTYLCALHCIFIKSYVRPVISYTELCLLMLLCTSNCFNHFIQFAVLHVAQFILPRTCRIMQHHLILK